MSSETGLILSALLLAPGLYLLLLPRIRGNLFEKEMLEKAKRKLAETRPEISLRERILELRGTAKPSLLREALHERGSFLPPLLAICAFAAGTLVFRSPVVALPLSLTCYLLPTWAAKLRSYSRSGRDGLETEAALSIITSTYLRTNDLVGAVEENIAYIKPPVKDLFERFLFEYYNVTPSVTVCLSHLKQRFTGKTERQWCDLAMEAQNTATVKYAMQSTLSEFRTLREVQSEYDTSLRQSMRDFRTIVLIIAAFIPGLYFYSGEWFSILTTTAAGKLTLSVLITVMLLGINRSIELQAPLSASGKGEKK